MSLFTKAQAQALPTAKKTAKSDKEEIHIEGLKQLAEVDALIKALTAVKVTLDASVKAEAFDHFFDTAQATAKRPDNFRGIDDYASASIELRKRSTASALSAEELEMFAKHKLAVEKVVSVQRLYGINPAYAANTTLLNKVSKAIAKIVPDDFIVVQEEQFKHVVNDATIDTAFKNKAPREIIEAITVMAIKPKLETTNIAAILDNVVMLLADGAE